MPTKMRPSPVVGLVPFLSVKLKVLSTLSIPPLRPTSSLAANRK